MKERREPAYRIESLRHSYDGNVVLDIPHLEIVSGRTHAVVGPNGAGKTTLLRLLALLESPSEGSIFFDRSVTFVMEDPFLFDTSVLANVMYGLRKHGATSDAAQRRAREALGLVCLEHLADRKARTLSSGEAKRLAIARAAALDVDVLLLDEPTTNVDKQSAVSIEDLIKHLAEDGRTVIFATHDLSQAYRLADEITTLVDGRPQDVSHENLFPGNVVREGGIKYMEISPGVKVWFDTPAEGRGIIRVDPRSIILSRNRIESSARNCFRGRITKASVEDNLVKICVDVGAEFTVLVTRASYEEMGLTLSEQVYATFKTSSVV